MKYLLITLLLPSWAYCKPIALMSEKEVIALTLYMEARGEGTKGIEAVASVIHNRSLYNKSSLKKICLAPKQFSCWNNKLLVEIPKDKVYQNCLVIAVKMTNNKFKPSHNYRFYYNPSLCSPKWAKSPRNSCVIGGHKFLNI